MFRKNYISFLAAIALLFVGSVAVSAQTAPVRGKVEVKKADGTVVPVSGALVEVFRQDAKGSLPSSKTNRRGEFSFAGFPLGQIFTLSVSGQGIRPEIVPNIKAGMEGVIISAMEGDGKRWTEEEVREAISNPAATAPTSSEPTADEKKAKEEYEKQVAEVAAKNKKIEEKNVVIQRVLGEGNQAFNDKNFDLAIVKFEEGYNADPKFVGSAPVLLNNKGAALVGRAITTYNNNVKAEVSTRLEAMGRVKKDLGDAAEAYNASWMILKNASPTEVTDPKSFEGNKGNALRGAKEAFRIMAATEQVDGAKMDAAKILIPEYIAFETDPAKKTEGQLILGDLYRVLGDSENSIAEYKKVLDTNPSNVDAMAGVGFSLVNLGYLNNDKTKMQEGANYLQQFADAAPDTHKLKDDAKGLIESLKKEQNLTPQKTAKPAPRKRP
ncbi:MAG TPA: hypothetical protein VK892_11875 [Pyrinomonadaceae bacterium]|nr:hypothetical protein [Pyrinomonadaceae bacterium]